MKWSGMDWNDMRMESSFPLGRYKIPASTVLDTLFTGIDSYRATKLQRHGGGKSCHISVL